MRPTLMARRKKFTEPGQFEEDTGLRLEWAGMPEAHLLKFWLGVSTFLILSKLEEMDTHIMATIQEILDDETTETADLATLVTVVQGLQQSVTDLQALVAELQASAGGLTPEQQSALDAINAAQDANDATIKSLLPPA